MRRATREVVHVIAGKPGDLLRELSCVVCACSDLRTDASLRVDITPEVCQHITSMIMDPYNCVPVKCSDKRMRKLCASKIPFEQPEIRGDVIDCFSVTGDVKGEQCFLCSDQNFNSFFYRPGCFRMSCGCYVHRGCAYVATKSLLPKKCPHGLLEFNYGKTRCHDSIRLAYVAGAEYTSVLTQLQHLSTRPTQLKIDPRDLAKALVYFYDLLDLRPFLRSQRFPTEACYPDFWRNLPHKETTKAGINFGDGNVKTNPTKGDVWDRDALLLSNLFREAMALCKVSDDVFIPFPMVAYKMSMKLETLLAKEDKDRLIKKTRLFYLPKNVQTMVDTMLMYPEMKMYSRRLPYLIGHRWPNGGAMNIARYFGAFNDACEYIEDPNFTYWREDQSYCDQHLLYLWYVILYAMHIMFYDDSDPNYPIVKESFKWTCGNSAFKFMKWTGNFDWRIIPGLNCSGKLDTGNVNTMALILLYLCWIFSLQREAASRDDQDTLDLIKNENNWKFFVQNGDDALRKLRKHPSFQMFEKSTNVYESWSGYANRTASYIFKESESKDNLEFYSTFDDKGYLVKEGVRLLQRSFVKDVHWGKPVVSAFRPTDSFVGKLAVPAADCGWNKQALRCIGFLIDTMGACYAQYVGIMRVFNRARIRAIKSGEPDPYLTFLGIVHNFSNIVGNPRDNYYDFVHKIVRLFGKVSEDEFTRLKFSYEGIRETFLSEWNPIVVDPLVPFNPAPGFDPLLLDYDREEDLMEDF